MRETIDQLKVGVRVLLRRVSDLKLPDGDIAEQLNDNLRAKLQDMQLGGRERSTRVVETQLVDDGIDFRLQVPGGLDAEIEKLEYGYRSSAQIIAFQEARIVPLQAYARAFDQGGVVAAIYGKNKVKLNMNCREACSYCWHVTYREPLLAIIESGATVPLPGDFVPMVKKEVAVACIPLVQDDTDGWTAWVSRALPLYQADILLWNNPGSLNTRSPARWQRYLAESNEPQVQDIRPFNSARRGLNRRINTRAFWPRG